MSWTDIDTVKKHLMQSEVAIASVENEEHTLVGTTAVQLNSAIITEDSEEVKTIDANEPYSEGAVVLNGTSWKNLSREDLVPGSVVVANDAIHSNFYIEGTDFVTDYENGRLKRVAGGAIGDGATVYVWFSFYTLHTRDTDYTIDYDAGTVARMAGGSIADGGIVYVDYTTTASTVPDALIEEAIVEGEDKILARLAEGYSADSTDQGLITGATELAIAIICNAKAMDIMNRTHADSSDDMSGQWRVMSLRFEYQAWKTLSRFLAKPAIRGAKTRVNMDLHG
jgi:hypothetical protein